MGVLESNDKSQLLKRSAQKREALEHEISLFSDKTEKVLTNALIIGGSLAVSYLLMRQFLKTKKRKRPKTLKEPEHEEGYSVLEQQPSFVSSIASEVGTALAGHLTAFLLQLAKEKLTEYLESHSKSKVNADH